MCVALGPPPGGPGSPAGGWSENLLACAVGCGGAACGSGLETRSPEGSLFQRAITCSIDLRTCTAVQSLLSL